LIQGEMTIIEGKFNDLLIYTIKDRLTVSIVEKETENDD
jgi:hypothetical protein